MTPAWALRQEELLSDCIVSPDVFNPMVDHLGEFVVPSQTTGPWSPAPLTMLPIRTPAIVTIIISRRRTGARWRSRNHLLENWRA